MSDSFTRLKEFLKSRKLIFKFDSNKYYLMTYNIQFVYLLIIFLFCNVFARAQEYQSLLGFNNYVNTEILVLTNRMNDHDTTDFRNEVDALSPLKVYSVTYVDSSFLVVPTTIKSYIQKHEVLGNEYVLFVHGDGKTFLHAAVRGLDIQNTYGVQVIVFAWPSRRDDGQVFNNLSTSLINLKLSGNHFAALIDSVALIKEEYKTKSIPLNFSMFLHSLGNEYLPQYVVSMDSTNHTKLFNNLVINAAAVNSKGHNSWVEKLNIQENIFINSNAKDVNLNGLRIISAYGYLMGELLVEPLAVNASYVNFSNAIGLKLPPGRSHTYYIGEHVAKSQNIRKYYSDLFHGKYPNFKDETMFILRKDGYGYDIIY